MIANEKSCQNSMKLGGNSSGAIAGLMSGGSNIDANTNAQSAALFAQGFGITRLCTSGYPHEDHLANGTNCDGFGSPA